MAFSPSPESYGDAPEKAEATSLWDKVTSTLTGGGALSAWSAVVDAISDPRERVKVLKAKIKNYKRMKEKYGIGPLADLYSNEIRLMKARLAAETEDLKLQEEGESSTRVWRYLGWGALGGATLWIGSKAVRSLRGA